MLDRFAELELVDDAAFAEQWVTSRHRVRGLSRRALANELRTKGVEPDVVSAATAAIGPDEELVAARTLAEKRLRSMGSVTDRAVRRRRLGAALARRGYGSEVVLRVLAELLDGDRDDPGDE